MSFALFDVADQRSAFPPGDDPAVTSRLLTMPQYVDLARRVIGRFAPPHARNWLLSSEDAVSFVAYRIMVADWGCPEGGPASAATRRGNAGGWAVGTYVARCSGGRGRVEVPDLADPSAATPDAQASRAEDAAEAADRLNGLLGQLTPTQRRCVVLGRVAGLRPFEIARALGVSREAARKGLGRGMRRLTELAGGSRGRV